MSSRKVQLYNGRALIKVKMNEGNSMVSVSSATLPTAFCTLSNDIIKFSGKIPAVPTLETSLVKKDVLETMTRVCDWQLANMPVPGDHPRRYYHWDWTNAALYTGIMAMGLLGAALYVLIHAIESRYAKG